MLTSAPTQRQTLTFSLTSANVGKLQRLQAELDDIQAATDFALQQYKLHVVMQQYSAYDSGKSIYALLRRQFPSLGSKAAQKLLAQVKASTLGLSGDRAKLLRTKRVDASLVYDNQTFDVKLTAETAHRQLWLQLGSRRSGLRLPLSGVWPAQQLTQTAVVSVDQVRIVRRLCKDQLKLFAHLSCTVELPPLRPCAAVDQVLGLDQNVRRLCTSDGRHIKLTAHTHSKRQLRQQLQRSGGPQQLRDDPRFRNWSNDFWRKQAAELASYCSAMGYAVVSIEDLKHIRRSAPAAGTAGSKGRRFNFWLHSGFPFAMFQSLLQAALAKRGIRLVQVPPKYTSQTCSACGRHDKTARRSQARFACTDIDCAHVQHADTNAAVNVKTAALWRLGLAAMPAAVQLPDARSVRPGCSWLPMACVVGSQEEPIARDG